MVGLFTQLVGRTLGLAPVLKPRPVSMYASEQGMVQGMVGDNPSDVNLGRELNPDLQMPENPTASERSPGDSKLAPLVVQDQSTLAITRLSAASIANAQSNEQLARSPNSTSLEPAPAIQETTTPFVEQRTQTANPKPDSSQAEMAGQDALPETHRTVSTLRTQPAEVSINSVEPVGNRATAVSASPTERTSNPSTEIVAGRNLTPPGPKPPAAQRPVITPNIAPLVPQEPPLPVASSTAAQWLNPIKPALQSNSPTMRSAAPPTIQVTIGRIEVRAVMESSPPIRQRSAPPAPKLSLQDYLKSRSGGNG